MPERTEGRTYDFSEADPRWNARWEADRLWHVDVAGVGSDEKFYNLVEFPYPSAEGLHVGHVYTYCGADTYSRLLRMRGRKVFQPMGFDSFGIHTENYALRVGENPMDLTSRTIENYRQLLRRVGAAWNWDHEVVTSDPEYYRWTQWIFVQLFKAGLAVRKEAPVVWCPSCLTVLANEQLEGDSCERCGTTVTHRVMEQWFFRITEYADRLLDGLDGLDWPDLAKTLQREWIGRSHAVEIDFPVADRELRLRAFTTRPDTLFGVTYVAIAADHPELERWVAGGGREDEVRAFAERVRRDQVAERGSGRDREGERGVPTGLVAINPANQARLPVYVADYVLADYGTGVVMGVPAHDARDHEFATLLGLPIRRVVAGGEEAEKGAWTGEGTLVESGRFTGLPSHRARTEIADWLEAEGLGRRATYYRMHDWLISRQRYWGPPIPIVYCDSCGTLPVPEDQLPVVLPRVEEFRPTGTGLSPLATVESFVNTTCPGCGGPARRETDVSDTFVDSSWYFLRYPSSDVGDRPWDPERTGRLLPVDMYAGGKEHVMRHHLYARFVTMALHDLGHLPFAEPFPRLRLHGLLISEGAKMSKSRGNVVNPSDYLARVGADNLRMYLLFCGPWEEGADFSDRDLMGVVRFNARVWRLLTAEHRPGPGGVDTSELDRATARVQRDVERLKFNTAIARLMELVRWLGEEGPRMSQAEWERSARVFTLLLAPFAPYMAEEIWSRLGGEYSVHTQPWPAYDESALRQGTFTLVVQVNGRHRDTLEAPMGASREEAAELALGSENVRRHLNGGSPRQVIYVPNRLINLLV